MSARSVDPRVEPELARYDREIRRLVPHYDELVTEGLAVLRALAPPNARVLDVGSGSGRMAAAILAAMPEAHVTLLDVDAGVLAKAKARLARDEARAAFVHQSFLEPLPRCDAIVACLSLHHVADLETKTRVYRAIADALPARAPFLCLDATVSDDPALSALTFTRWSAAMADYGIDEPTARAHFASWLREEHYFPLADELAALRSAGFAHPECFWRRGPMTIFGGRK